MGMAFYVRSDCGAAVYARYTGSVVAHRKVNGQTPAVPVPPKLGKAKEQAAEGLARTSGRRGIVSGRRDIARRR